MKILDEMEGLLGIAIFALLVWLIYWLWKNMGKPSFKGLGGGGGAKSDAGGQGSPLYDPDSSDSTRNSPFDVVTGITMVN